MKVISLINMKGGVAKTTLAVNICDCMAVRQNLKVLLIDIDPQFNATQCLMSGEDYIKYRKDGKDTIYDVFEKGKPIISTVDGVSEETPKSLASIEAYKVKNNFDLLPGNLELNILEMPSGSGAEFRLKKYLSEIKAEEKYDYVIIDTPPTPSIWLTSALLASDYYLIPVKADPLSLIGIDLLQNIIQSKKDNYGVNIMCLGVVLTMVETHQLVYKEAQEFLKSGRWKEYLFGKELPKRVAIARDQTSQRLILDLQEPAPKVAITAIVDELLSRIS